ncbi:hypothetical protein MTsPCn5_28810 [Croceitalea sp. MTPC5]|uniref:hypothetical protein n=1 Tax=Croceitalea sp. MTPC5 TaxID=3056565 RepID=UPI002B3A11CB|nr:hypothetical protein MTsPCn5_28810 [Croceitalea sp. MTPC5]
MSKPMPDKSDTSPKNQFVRYDEYWLQKARDSIDGTTQALTQRLESLNKFLNYLVAGAFLGVGGVTYATYLESPKWYIYLAFIIPLVIVGIAKYKVSIDGGELELRNTDMRSPTQINEAYFRIIAAQSKKVKDAAGYVGLATFFILICFPLAIFLQNLEESKDVPDTYFSVTTDSKSLYIQGNLGNVEKVWAVLYGKDLKNNVRPPIHADFLLQKKGQLDIIIDLKKLGLKLEKVELFYSEKDKKFNHIFGFGKENLDASKKVTNEPRKTDESLDSLKIK